MRADVSLFLQLPILTSKYLAILYLLFDSFSCFIFEKLEQWQTINNEKNFVDKLSLYNQQRHEAYKCKCKRKTNNNVFWKIPNSSEK